MCHSLVPRNSCSFCHFYCELHWILLYIHIFFTHLFVSFHSFFFLLFIPPLLFNIQAIQLELCLWVQIKNKKKKRKEKSRKETTTTRIGKKKTTTEKKYKLGIMETMMYVQMGRKEQMNAKCETKRNRDAANAMEFYHNFQWHLLRNQKVTHEQIDTKLWLNFIYSCHSRVLFIFPQFFVLFCVSLVSARQ